ncbi:MAG: multicopper oxidase family protein [Ectothiorhodospiraceae bacterium]|nr:multicopper oxidase family protein [Ectothiorhodospiraceae bacterium]MBN4052985.1 multicopper oxidase family protein [Gammaproteobacteria bacterium AH-315-K14]
MKTLTIATALCFALALPFANASKSHDEGHEKSHKHSHNKHHGKHENKRHNRKHDKHDKHDKHFSKRTKAEAFGLQLLEDINPDPRIVEINLEAREDYVELIPGVPSKVYTYNGSVPGPLIRGTVGDTLIIHFTNNLTEPTTIHWHGLRLPADMDGSSVAQNPLQPGESFTYKYELKEASLFWYHPHVRSNEQVEKGLAGALLVSEKKHDLDKRIRKVKQKILILDDVLLDADGQIEEAFVGTQEEVLLKKINGRTGNTLLVNGREMPTMHVKSGEPIRWRMVNIANTRFMRVSVPGHKLTRIGGDGGLLETPIKDMDDVFLVPGQRADVMFVPKGKPGSELIVYWKDTKRGRHSINIMDNGMVMMGHDELDGNYPDIPLMRIVFKKGHKHAKKLKLPHKLRTIEPIDVAGAAETTLKFGHSMPKADGSIKFLINGKTFRDVTTHDAPDAQVGETQVWNLVNMTGGDHPFHLHGFFFQVMETIYKDPAGNVLKVVPAPPLENVDMVNLPARNGPRGSVTITKIAINFSPAEGLTAADIAANGGTSVIENADLEMGQRGRAGGWQFHCHILEHADTGMMSFVEVFE